jgi:hypothetical protein
MGDALRCFRQSVMRDARTQLRHAAPRPARDLMSGPNSQTAGQAPVRGRRELAILVQRTARVSDKG